MTIKDTGDDTLPVQAHAPQRRISTDRPRDNGERHPREWARIPVFVAHADPITAAGIRALLEEDPRFSVSPASPGVADAPATSSLVVADHETALALLAARGTNRVHAGTARLLIVTARFGEAEIRAAMTAGAEGYLLLHGCSAGDLQDAAASVAEGGRYMSTTVARRLADSFMYSSLTARELDILALLASGMSNKSLAQAFDISLGTVKSHVASILDKLSARSRTEAVHHAQARGLICPGDRQGGGVARSDQRRPSRSPGAQAAFL